MSRKVFFKPIAVFACCFVGLSDKFSMFKAIEFILACNMVAWEAVARSAE